MLLKKAEVVIAPGLSDKEMADIEREYKFTFPEDYRALLMEGLPISNGFINWREASLEDIQRKLQWPYEGICFDVEFNNFWFDEWGEKPESLNDAFAVVAKAVHEAPTLIPIYGHRYIPGYPLETGNPIFSVYQTDIIYYGRDLFEYLENELRIEGYRYHISEPVKYIPFWSFLTERNSGYEYKRL